MKCSICKNSETTDGYTSITFSKEQLVYVVKNVPARICDNCGEQYVDKKTASALLKTANEAFKNNVIIDVREFKAA
jgi:YgiT-type zinc finger domain-containing protein